MKQGMGARRCGIVMGGASPTFKYDYVAHVSARTRHSPSLLLGYVVQGEGLGTRLAFIHLGINTRMEGLANFLYHFESTRRDLGARI